MLTSGVLDVVIGLAFIFLLYSLLATSVSEALAIAISLRAKMLQKGITQMLTDTQTRKHGWLLHFIIGAGNLVGSMFTGISSLLIGEKAEKKFLHEKFYDHPLLKNYGESKFYAKPSYLSSGNFSSILLDILNTEKERYYNSKAISNLLAASPPQFVAPWPQTLSPAHQSAIEKELGGLKSGMNQTEQLMAFFFDCQQNGSIIPCDTARILENLLKDSTLAANKFLDEQYATLNAQAGAAGVVPQITKQQRIDKTIEFFKLSLETWFNDSMVRVSSWYKRQTHWILLALGFAMAICFNIDTIEISNKLSHDKEARMKLADMASAYMSSNKSPNTKQIGIDSAITAQQEQKNYDSLVNYSRQLLTKDIQGANNLLSIGYNGFGEKDTIFRKILQQPKQHYCCIYSGNFYYGFPYCSFTDTISQYAVGELNSLTEERAELAHLARLTDTLTILLNTKNIKDSSIVKYYNFLKLTCEAISNSVSLKSTLINSLNVRDTARIRKEYRKLITLIKSNLHTQNDILAIDSLVGGKLDDSVALQKYNSLKAKYATSIIARIDTDSVYKKLFLSPTLSTNKTKHITARTKTEKKEVPTKSKDNKNDSRLINDTIIRALASRQFDSLMSYRAGTLLTERDLLQDQFNEFSYQLGVISRFNLNKIGPKDDIKKGLEQVQFLSDSLSQTANFMGAYSKEISEDRAYKKLYQNFFDKIRFLYVWYIICTSHKLLGFLITAFAISLGAPFWFDLLNKFVKIRGAIKEEDKK